MDQVSKMNQLFQKIHQEAILIDTHNDILTQAINKGHFFDKNLKGKTHSDLQRWKKGGVDVQFFVVWSDGDQKDPFDYANQQLDIFDAVLKRNPDKVVLARNGAELYAVLNESKLAAMLALEGGHMIEDDLSKLEAFYKRGVRYMTLTWNNSNSWATSASDETNKKDLKNKGLTNFGKKVIQRMNQLGMLVDVSHVGEATFWDVINTSTKTVFASHSNVYALCPHERNLKDDQIKAIAKCGGVIQVNFFSGFLDPAYFENKSAFINKHKSEYDALMASGKHIYRTEEFLFNKYRDEVEVFRAPFEMVIEHIEYIINLVGIDYVGIGSDFDGIESPAMQLDDVTTYPLITKALVERGYSKEEISKVLGGNFLRVLKAYES